MRNGQQVKICFLFPYNTWGGAFRSTYELCNRLNRKSEYEVEVVFPFIAPQVYVASGGGFLGAFMFFRSLVRSVVRGARIPWFNTEFRARTIFSISPKGLRGYDVIVANHWHTLRPIYNLELDCRKFIYIRDIEVFEPYYARELEDFRLPIDKIVVASWINERFKELNIPTGSVITNGTNLEPFLNTRDRSIKQEKVIVGMCYAVHKAKDMEGGVNVLRAIKSRNPNVEILLFGFPLKPNLDFDFKYVLRPTGEALRNVYEGIDIFFCPSIQEGFHNPPREAMAAGCAVVATDIGCIPDLGRDGENMFIVKPRSYEVMIDRICDLVNSANLRMEFGKNASKRIAKEDWAGKVKDFEKLLGGLPN